MLVVAAFGAQLQVVDGDARDLSVQFEFEGEGVGGECCRQQYKGNDAGKESAFACCPHPSPPPRGGGGILVVVVTVVAESHTALPPPQPFLSLREQILVALRASCPRPAGGAAHPAREETMRWRYGFAVVANAFCGQAGAGCAVFSQCRLDFFAARLHVGKTVFVMPERFL